MTGMDRSALARGARCRDNGFVITILDGPVGSLLADFGVETPAPLWSAAAITSAPEVVAGIHEAYARAGACVHTACTFRTKRRQAGAGWERLTRRAVEIARGAAAAGQRVAGSLSPLEDCYRPDLSPADARVEHREMARALAGAGVDLILCETFPHVGEALVAVEEAARTGLPVWVAFTGGPDGALLSAAAVGEGARAAAERGAVAVLVNCTGAGITLPYVERLAKVGVPFGAYANAGREEDGIGWGARRAAGLGVAGGPDGSGVVAGGAAGDERAVSRYVELARAWVEAGATIVGSCCGTGPEHVAGLARAFGERGDRVSKASRGGDDRA